MSLVVLLDIEQNKTKSNISKCRNDFAGHFTMRVYFDTEFTDLVGAAHDPALISIGLTADSGAEFYAELTDTWNKSICSPFVLEAVLPHLQYQPGADIVPICAMDSATLAARLGEWLESFNEQVTLFCDSIAYDWMWIGEIFDGRLWPKNLKRECRSTLAFESDRERFAYNAAEQDYWRTQQGQGAVRHHALWDARSIKFAHRYSMRKRG